MHYNNDNGDFHSQYLTGIYFLVGAVFLGIVKVSFWLIGFAFGIILRLTRVIKYKLYTSAKTGEHSNNL